MQARDVMTRDVVTVGPDTSVKYAAEVMAERGFAALPVVDDDMRLVGIVAEADVLTDRMPPDPRLHLRRDEADDVDRPPPLLVRGVMTAGVRSVETGTDIADIARLFVDDRLRSVPVLERDRLLGIVSRRDLLRVLVRTDDVLRTEVLRLVEDYTAEPGAWEVTVTEGMATIRRLTGAPEGAPEVERRALRALAHTVAGVVGARILPAPDDGGRPGAPSPVDAGTSA